LALDIPFSAYTMARRPELVDALPEVVDVLDAAVGNLLESVPAQRTPGGGEGAVVLTGSATKPGVGVGDAAARVGSSGAAGGVAEGAISLIGSGNLCSEFATSWTKANVATIPMAPSTRK
jgi:hypothetical protein